MSHLAAIFAASFGFIFLKALQQRNVQHNDFLLVLPTSMTMAIFEIYVIAQVVIRGYGIGIVLAWGAGAGLGALCAMYLHNIHLTRKSAQPKCATPCSDAAGTCRHDCPNLKRKSS